MEFYSCIKLIHAISAAFLFGATILLFIYCVWSYTQDCDVILSDAFQTITKLNLTMIAPSGALQLITGFTLVYLKAEHYSTDWIASVLSAYSISTLCWICGMHLLGRCQELLVTIEGTDASCLNCIRSSFITWVVLCIIAMSCMATIFDLMNAKSMW